MMINVRKNAKYSLEFGKKQYYVSVDVLYPWKER